MSEEDEMLPPPLRATGASKLEQRLLDAAARERPSQAAKERMARAIGIAPPAIGAGGHSSGETVAPPVGAASGGLLPWISGAVLAVAMGGAWIALRTDAPTETPAPNAAPPPAASSLPPTPEKASPVAASTATESSVVSTAPRARPTASASDLGEQIALLDSARSAMNAGKHERALELLQRYLVKYPTGSFRPEATALKIESLAEVGRGTEARALADRFVSEHRGTPLGNRVKDLTKAPPRGAEASSQ
jgi:hypothetical protein